MLTAPYIHKLSVGRFQTAVLKISSHDGDYFILARLLNVDNEGHAFQDIQRSNSKSFPFLIPFHRKIVSLSYKTLNQSPPPPLPLRPYSPTPTHLILIYLELPAGFLGPSTALSTCPAIPFLLASNWLPITPSELSGPPIFSPTCPMVPLGLNCEPIAPADERIDGFFWERAR